MTKWSRYHAIIIILCKLYWQVLPSKQICGWNTTYQYNALNIMISYHKTGISFHIYCNFMQLINNETKTQFQKKQQQQ